MSDDLKRERWKDRGIERLFKSLHCCQFFDLLIFTFWLDPKSNKKVKPRTIRRPADLQGLNQKNSLRSNSFWFYALFRGQGPDCHSLMARKEVVGWQLSVLSNLGGGGFGLWVVSYELWVMSYEFNFEQFWLRRFQVLRNLGWGISNNVFWF